MMMMKVTVKVADGGNGGDEGRRWQRRMMVMVVVSLVGFLNSLPFYFFSRLSLFLLFCRSNEG